MTPEELLIDDHEFETPIYVSVQEFTRKWEEAKHRRDKAGRFADTASVTVGDRQIAVVKPRRAAKAGDVMVPLDVVRFDEEFQREEGFYLGVGGHGGIGNRYERFGQFIGQANSIEAAEVTVQENGRVGFTNGRHRYAWLRDQGLTSIPVAMTPESAKHAKRYGLLAPVKKAWDESQHPRDAEGQFTAQGLVALFAEGKSPTGAQILVSAEDWGYGSTKFILPSGKRLAHMQDTHAAAAHALGVDLDDVMRAGILRYTPGSGAEIGAPMTKAQAQHLVDSTIESGGNHPLFVDVFHGRERFAKVFDPDRTNANTVRNWVNSHFKVQKGEHAFGNTQIQIAPTSSAAMSLNMARDAISDDDVMASGKDVDPNHLTVRFGLLNEDLNKLRTFITEQTPFTAYVEGVELFPVSDHSDGAVPVVAVIESPELRDIEAEIGNYADFKEKSFPVYKPHCTLAYCKPEAAPKYKDLAVGGSFTVQSITISHQSGVLETIPFGMVAKREWTEAQHRRQPKGSAHGGEFVAGPKDALESMLHGEKVGIARGDVRKLLEKVLEQKEDPNLTHLQVEGMTIFGGEGLGIKREDMPQVPKVHRRQFLQEMEANGVKILEETVDPLTLKPTQKEIGARNVAEKLERYEKGGKVFPPLLVSSEGRILDGHHHWGMMAAFAVDVPEARVPIYRLMVSTKKALALMHAYNKKHGIERKALGQKKDPVSGRYVTPFVDFSQHGSQQLQLIASLNSSRLATWGFTAEAEVLGMARYKLTAVLDGRTSQFCRFIDGKIFNVPEARRKVIEVLEVQNPEDLRVVQPWPKQTRAAMAAYAEMSSAELTERGLHIPPYHPYCRTICRAIASSAGKVLSTVPTIPAEVEAFQQVTAADLKEMGVEATPEQVAQWNEHVGMTPVELLSKLSQLPPQEVMTKGQGVGTRPVTFDADGDIGFKVNGETPSGVEFKLNAILEPFTGTYYLTQAELLAGNPKAELQFLKTLFMNFIEMGMKSSATSLAIGVAGNAPYYAQLGFLPDELEWDSLRLYAQGQLESEVLQPVLASLTAEDRLLVEHLLQDHSPWAMSALVELPFTYEGRTIGEWLFAEASGTWALDLTDDLLVAQARGHLA